MQLLDDRVCSASCQLGACLYISVRHRYQRLSGLDCLGPWMLSGHKSLPCEPLVEVPAKGKVADMAMPFTCGQWGPFRKMLLQVNYALAAGKASGSDDSGAEDGDDVSSSSDAESAGSEPADDASDGPSAKRSRTAGTSKAKQPSKSQQSGSGTERWFLMRTQRKAKEVGKQNAAAKMRQGEAVICLTRMQQPKRSRGAAALGSDDGGR